MIPQVGAAAGRFSASGGKHVLESAGHGRTGERAKVRVLESGEGAEARVPDGATKARGGKGMEPIAAKTASAGHTLHLAPMGWKTYLLIAGMGFVGAVLRYALELAFAGAVFPWGTLIINVVGSFALVVINGFVGRRLHVTAGLVRAMGVGLLGAFTTLSAFTKESIGFFVAGRPGLALVYIAATYILCLGAALAGLAADGLLAKRRYNAMLRRHRAHHAGGEGR